MTISTDSGRRLTSLVRTERAHTVTLGCAWFVTRLVMLLFALNVLAYYQHSAIANDVHLYRDWGHLLAQAHFPRHDVQWQYPPAAAYAIETPKLLANHIVGASYYVVFYSMALIADAITTALLIGAGRRAARAGYPAAYLGPWAWVVGVFSIGPLAIGRFDVIATVFAVAALLVNVKDTTRAARLRGALIGLGAAIKLWPGLLLLGVRRGRDGRRTVWAAVVAALVPTVALVLSLPGSMSFLSSEGGRGLEVESVPATPFIVLRWFGVHERPRLRYGSFEIIGPGVQAVADLCLPLTVVGIALLMYWRRRWRWTPATMADVGLAGVLIAIVTSRVLSPQYQIWLLGMVAVCLLFRGSTQRPACLLVFVAVLMSQFEYPLTFPQMMNGSVWAALVLFVRNAVLIAATVRSLRALPRGGNDGDDGDGTVARAPHDAEGEQSAVAGGVPA